MTSAYCPLLKQGWDVSDRDLRGPDLPSGHRSSTESTPSRHPKAGVPWQEEFERYWQSFRICQTYLMPLLTVTLVYLRSWLPHDCPVPHESISRSLQSRRDSHQQFLIHAICRSRKPDRWRTATEFFPTNAIRFLTLQRLPEPSCDQRNSRRHSMCTGLLMSMPVNYNEKMQPGQSRQLQREHEAVCRSRADGRRSKRS